MKNNVDRLYDSITGKMTRNRRLLPVIAVLSVFVSTSVIWGLRDTGITMANLEECGKDEHIHTDECYGDILVCGYDPDGNKLEDGDPGYEYEYVCTCGFEEDEDHEHDADCFEFVRFKRNVNAEDTQSESEDGEGSYVNEDADTDEVVIGGEGTENGSDTENTDTDAKDTASGTAKVMTLSNKAAAGSDAEVMDEAVTDVKAVTYSFEDEDAQADSEGVHVHTAECYARGLVCGKVEHKHKFSCYFGDTGEDEESDLFKVLDDESSVVMLSADVEDDGGFFDASEMMVGANGLGTMDTIDNIAEGIKFNLFDYVSNELEAETNHYGISWDRTKNEWVHNNYSNAGINAGRDPETDIMFFAYGTPAFTGTNKSTGSSHGVNNNTGENVYTRILPDKNNYSGDYNYFVTSPENAENLFLEGMSDTLLEQVSGNRPVLGIVDSMLGKDGYPVVSGTDHSLAYLFDPNFETYEYKITNSDGNEETKVLNIGDVRNVYTDVNHLLQKKAGTNKLFYDSNMNYAYFDQESGNFIVYDDTFKIINNDHHAIGDINYNIIKDGKPREYEDNTGYELKIGFFPFDEYDSSRRDPNYNGNAYNHHFGMTMEADFYNWQNDAYKDDIYFYYSGDDDMWVFVDGELALDVGGIHEPAAGMIDFTHGVVWTQDDKDPKFMLDGEEIRSKTYAEWVAIYPNLDEYPKPKDYNAAGKRWIVDFKSWSYNATHNIKMFYLERGGCYSNLAMEMNLPTVKNLVVYKDVEKSNVEKDSDIDNADYYFRVLEGSSADANDFTDAYLGEGISNYFTLKAGQRMVFENLPIDRYYKIEEYNINTGVYSNVNVDSRRYESKSQIQSDAHVLTDVNVYNFTNVVKREDTNIQVKKVWDEINPQSHDPIKFKLYRKDSKNQNAQKELVAIGGKRIFTIPNDTWVWNSPDLPKIYGDHVYTYSVEELNCPRGYDPTYSKDDNGNITITNSNQRKTVIHVEKQWENMPQSERPEIKLTLTRQYREILEVKEETTLTVQICDELGMPLGTYEPINGVYVGGGIEFSIDLPEGSHYYHGNNNDKNHECFPNTLEYDDSYGDEGYFAVSNLAKSYNANGSEVQGNLVKIYVTTDNIEDSLLLMHHSFTHSFCGWSKDSCTIVISGNTAQARTDGILVKERKADWAGPLIYLDPAKFKAGQQYTFSIYVYGTVANTKFSMTFNDGLGNANGNYHNVGQPLTVADANTWTQLTGTIRLPDKINPYGMFLKVQTDDTNEFRIDEFSAIEGNQTISSDRDTGVVRVAKKPQKSYGTSTYYNTYPVDGGFGGWTAHGNSKIKMTPGLYNEDTFFVVSGRQANHEGIELKVKDYLEPGKTYLIKATISANGDIGKHSYTLTLDKILPTPNSNNDYRHFSTIARSEEVNDYDWAVISKEYTVPSTDIDIDNAYIYIESDNNSDFRLYHFEITPVFYNSSEPKVGYSMSDNEYYTDFSNFIVIPEEDSITNPYKKTEYLPDSTFANNGIANITIPAGSDDVVKLPIDVSSSEESYKEYLYSIEETWIGSMDKSAYEVYYDVDYFNRDVSKNDESDPIIVHNKYIWYRLPATGGSGTTVIFVTGAAFIFFGLAGAFIAFRRKKKEN